MTLLLRKVGLEWRVSEQSGGYVLVVMSQAEYARMWLRERGYRHTKDLGDVEVWTK